MACQLNRHYEDWILIMLRISATQSVPTFVKYILGERVHEEESVMFEALYSGNPVPGEIDNDQYTNNVLKCNVIDFICTYFI